MFEVIFVGVIALFIGMMIGSLGSTPQTRNKPIDDLKQSEHDKRFKEQEEVLKQFQAALQAKKEEFEAKFKADTERYIVEVTDSKGKVYKTEEFEPKYYVDERYYGSRAVEALYNSSRQNAESYVTSVQDSGHPLVQFDLEYVCRNDIKGVKLVKVK